MNNHFSSVGKGTIVVGLTTSVVFFFSIFKLIALEPIIGKLRFLLIFVSIQRAKCLVKVFATILSKSLINSVSAFAFGLDPTIKVHDVSINKFIIKGSLLCESGCISYSETLTSTSLKLSFIDLLFQNLSSMIVLESPLELSDILGSIGHQNTVSMDLILQPLANILHTIVIFQLICLDTLEQLTVFLRNRLIFVVRQAQAMIESEIKLLEFGSDFTRNGLNNGDYFGFARKTVWLRFQFRLLLDV